MVFFILMAMGVKLAEMPAPEDILIANSPLLKPSA